MSIWKIPEEVSEYKAYLKKDDSKVLVKPIVAFGDSITLCPMIEPEKRWTRLLENRINTKVINAGIGATTSSFGLERLDRDVLSLNPGTVIFCFLLNDGFIAGWESVDSYYCKLTVQQSCYNTREIIKRCRNSGIEAVMWTAAPIGKEYPEKCFPQDYSECPLVKEFNRIQRERYEYFLKSLIQVAESENVLVADTYKTFLNTGDPQKYLGEDNIHHNEIAQVVISDSIYELVLRS